MLAVALGLWGCGGDETRLRSGEPGGSVPGASAEGEASPVYAMVTLVWSDDGMPTGYVALTDTLDVSEITLDAALEFPSYTSAAVAGGQLLVNPSWEDLTIAGHGHAVAAGTLGDSLGIRPEVASATL